PQQFCFSRRSAWVRWASTAAAPGRLPDGHHGGPVSSQDSPLHPIDDAVALEPAGDGRVRGRTVDAWANMVGPFGGTTAATMLQAVRSCFSRRSAWVRWASTAAAPGRLPDGHHGGPVSSQDSPLHPIDDAVALEPAGDGRVRGRTVDAWANMVGPFGGTTAATMLQAV